MPHKIGTGAIMGIASEDGLPAQKRVTLMDRTDLRIISKVTSDEYGAYAFNGLNTETNDYIVFAVDDNDPKKAAIIYDYVKPIPVHRGGALFANWSILSLKKEANVSIIGSSSSELGLTPYFPFGVGGSSAEWAGSVINPNKLPLAPAAYTLGTVGLVDAAIGRQGQNQKNIIVTRSAIDYSGEWLLDLSSVVGDAGAFFCRSAKRCHLATGDNYASSMLSIKYNSTTKTIGVYRFSGAVATVDQRANPDTNTLLTLEYVVPIELQDKAVHIAASVTYGVSCELYLNGVLVNSVNLTGTSTHSGHSIYGSQKNVFAVVGAANYSPSNTQNPMSNKGTFDFGMVAFYLEVMTAVEAMEHYKALFEDTLPRVTGYSREVMVDNPVYFYRFNEQVETFFAVDRLRPDNKNSNNNLTEVSPELNTRRTGNTMVLGGDSVLLNGGWYQSTSNGPRAPMSSYYLSIEVMLQPKDGTLNDQAVVTHTDTAKSLRLSFILYKGVAGYQINLRWRETGAVAKFCLFNHVVDTTSMNHYVVTLDKVMGKASLYINSILIEVLDVSTNAIEGYVTEVLTDPSLMYIGRSPNWNQAEERYSNPYYGYIAELSVYPIALTAERVKAHYDARLTP